MRGDRLVPQSRREINNQLAQSRPSDTNATSIYSPDDNVTGLIRLIKVCNTSSSTATFRIFHDADGTTYNENTALEWDIAIAANDSWQNDCDIGVKSVGNFAIRTGTASALTFTLYGVEIT